MMYFLKYKGDVLPTSCVGKQYSAKQNWSIDQSGKGYKDSEPLGLHTSTVSFTINKWSNTEPSQKWPISTHPGRSKENIQGTVGLYHFKNVSYDDLIS